MWFWWRLLRVSEWMCDRGWRGSSWLNHRAERALLRRGWDPWTYRPLEWADGAD